MGIVAYCPQGHRVKVKDDLAGKKGLCPICGVKFRIPPADGGPPHERPATEAAHGEAAEHGRSPPLPEATAAGLPTARFVSIDPAVVATLPRAVPASAAAETAVIASVPPAPTPGTVPVPVEPVAAEQQRPLHPTIAERPDLAWSIALPGGDPLPPLSAVAMQDWLDAREWTGEEFVWRADWPQWLPFRQVFPECTA